MEKPNFCEGVFASKINTQYGEIINLEIDVDRIRRNLTRENDKGHDVIYAQLKTSKDGKLYAVMNEFKYNHPAEDDKPPF